MTDGVDLPLMIPVVQHFAAPEVADVEAAMRAALDGLRLRSVVGPGMRVAITAGSRGIRNIPLILRTAAGYLKELGAEPVVVAAMGSHGGGTAEGQLAVLRSLGVTPEAVGCAVHGGVEVVELGRTGEGRPVYFDAFAAACDGVLVINRIKPHTSFRGRLESGLVKMMVVGLGKPAGAAQFHACAPERLSDALAEMGRVILQRAPILGGIAVLENAREETADLVPVGRDELIEREMALLERARALLPRLPVRALDLLIVEEMGKDIAGTGMDTNVIGRVGIFGVPDGDPAVRRIVVLDLTEASHGNANGMGLADFITRRFQRKIDFPTTYLNTLTATFVQRARMPIVCETDRDAIATALRTLGRPAPDRVRAMRIRNTLMLERLWVSPAVWAEIGGSPGLTAAGPPGPMRFDPEGRLLPEPA
ncbi:hypothetical protein J2Z79_002551 [Symbiobacterium terraclitae]|uniref:LarA-like N-terminal domain-containing protein n=1 Tax=Symbiobacterium terraclitae TaxID=557451 RepID=A0ABS4JUC6_9FIRM|nr:lactate racemase domain-containing protein [Symbiobacterium terraclitae]MBP2019134.1 hypothetical protein [Symbiobacterium terraclitae]